MHRLILINLFKRFDITYTTFGSQKELSFIRNFNMFQLPKASVLYLKIKELKSKNILCFNLQILKFEILVKESLVYDVMNVVGVYENR